MSQQMKSLQTRLFSFVLLLTLAVTLLCAGLSPAHACCPKAKEHQINGELPACCVSQAVVLPKPPPVKSGLDSGSLPGASHHPSFQPDWRTFRQSEDLSRLACRFVPDQSNRHQELNVWLN